MPASKKNQNNRQVGTQYEIISSQYLEKLGYIILSKNYRCRSGEIDIIAKDQDYIVFVEVKFRHSTAYGIPAEAVNYVKRQRIIRVAQYYLMQHGLYESKCRFDVISLTTDTINHIKNAFYPGG
jgi:putative endonuclease